MKIVDFDAGYVLHSDDIRSSHVKHHLKARVGKILKERILKCTLKIIKRSVEHDADIVMKSKKSSEKVGGVSKR